jgi:hypothetical protein
MKGCEEVNVVGQVGEEISQIGKKEGEKATFCDTDVAKIIVMYQHRRDRLNLQS